MISTLRGIVSEKNLEEVVLEVGGVGYGVRLTENDFSVLSPGETVKVYVHEHVREQSYDLFGFLNAETKSLFNQLLGVKNVGPKVAMAVLDVGSTDEVRTAISGGDVKLLQSAKGVGKRAAEQIVVELRDKMGLLATDRAEDIINRPGVDNQDEAVEALMALGYSPVDAATALKDIDKELSTEERIKRALKA